LRVLADVFQATVVPLKVSNSSALGAALRAARAVGGHDWADLTGRFSAPATHLAVAPDPTTREVYAEAARELDQRRNEVMAKLFVKR
jgi:sugar (pentulose or hexulose) kinase